MNFTDIPFNDITKFGQQTMLERPLFATSWILGRFCNYNCSYCWPYARSSTVDHHPLELYKNTIDEIKRQAKLNGFTEFHWSFSGGEPTAYKHLIDLTGYLTNDNHYQSIHMTTNLSPSKTWWAKWASHTNLLARRSLTASYHDEFANEDEFGDKILQLMNDGVYVTINQVMVPSKFYELYDRLERFANRGINVTLKPQSNQHANAIVDGYDDTMIKYMQVGFPQHVNGEELFQIKLYDLENNEYQFDQAERFNAFGFNKFEGWNCNSGYQSIIIRGNEVKRSYSCQDIPLGSLTDGFKLFKSPEKCTTNICVSSADSKVPKCKID
jgi:MoaA/NifB/PqqE/SkfB family radical SAM enzyme